jgi:hypothetical protein
MYFFWSLTMFPSFYANNANDLFFSQMYICEFFVYTFIRTRTSIKYLPKFITIVNIMFLIYLNSYMYSPSLLAVFLLDSTVALIILYFLLHFEQPAVVDWNPFERDTPSERNPRSGYTLVLNDASFGLGFNMWTMFLPVNFRNRFTLAEQGEFDRLN